jgi:hypothetical protein
MLYEEKIKQIHQLIDEGKFSIETHAQEDIIKQNYNWSIDFIKKCLKEGKLYTGKELYPGDSKRKERYYCIHKQSFISINLVLICFLIKDGIVIIHMQPLNRSSREGRIYFKQ